MGVGVEALLSYSAFYQRYDRDLIPMEILLSRLLDMTIKPNSHK
jgi:hypothetical protein